MVQVKGSTITARVRWIREHHGEGAWIGLRDSLPDDDRIFLEGRVLPHTWVPYDVFLHLSIAIDRRFGAGDLELCRVVARYAAEVNLPTLYRVFYRFGTPTFILRKAARLWDVHYSSGRLEVEEIEAGHVVLRILDFERPHRAHCLAVLGWAERSTELSGATLRRAEETRCRTRGDDVCEMRLEWSEK